MKKLLIGFAVFALLTGSAFADWVPEDGHKMHFPQMPNPSGWDVNATQPAILADDWQCSETGLITDIHFWGSWKDLDGDGHGDEGNITSFVISIHADIPASPPDIPYSRPGTTLREWEISMYVVAPPADPPTWEGWYDPTVIPPIVVPQDHQEYWQYNITDIPNLVEIPFEQQAGTIYWLNICAIVEQVPDPQPIWGWKSTLDHWNDDAVWATWGNLDWVEMYEPMPDPPIVNEFNVFFGAGGEFIDGWGEGAYTTPENPSGWYYYPNTNWWNIWFYDHPLVTGRKHIHIEFDAFGPGVQTAIFAVNWSTNQWDMPDEPPLPGVDEELYIGRAEFSIVEGRNVFDYDIEFYNPEWVSIDFMVFDVMDVPWGLIDHQCIPSLDLAFVINGETGEDPVYDLWQTPENHTTFVDFGCPSIPPIPTDFFEPGSEPFDGVIYLKGEPLPTNPPGILGPTDTIVERIRAANLDDCPSTDEVQTQIVALNLVSTEPITVTYDGGSTEEWDVRVCLSEVEPQPLGFTNFSRVCDEGGTFIAYIPVIPKYIFTRIPDGLIRVLDFGVPMQPIIVEYNIYEDYEGYWVDSFFDVYVSPPEGVWTSNCDVEFDIFIGPSAVDLIPGVQAIPCDDCGIPSEDHIIPITSLLMGLPPDVCAQQDVWPPHDVAEPIPTLNEWGMILLALLLLVAGTIAVIRRRRAAEAREM